MLLKVLDMSYNSKISFPSVPRVRLGDFIIRSTVNNKDLRYGVDLIRGVSNEGVFTNPKGSTLDINLSPYKIVNDGAFVYNPSRLNIGSLAYRTEGLCIVSHLYIVFYLNDEGKKRIHPEYLISTEQTQISNCRQRATISPPSASQSFSG